MHHVYIVHCADGSLYTGYATDLERRVAQHNAGRGAKYTAGRRPVQLVYTEVCKSRGAALSREHQVKGWTRTKKETLIKAVARRHSHEDAKPRREATKTRKHEKT